MTVKETLDRFDTRSILAILLVSAVIALMFVLGVRNPESDVFKILLGGVMTVGFASVVGWYFASSSGSAMKDEALAKTTAAQTETIAAQSQALASSAPIAAAGPVTTTHVDAKAGTAETTTAPVTPPPTG